MKKLIIGLFVLLAAVVVSGPIHASGLNVYTTNISTYPATEAATLAVQLAGIVWVQKVYVTNSSTTTAQTVTFYENATSTTAVTTSWAFDFTSGDDQREQFDWNVYSAYWKAQNIAIRKSSTGSNIKVTIWYR